MRLLRCLATTAAAAAVLVSVDARGDRIARDYRFFRLNDAKSFQHAPGPFLTAPRTCAPDAPAIPGVTIPLAPDLLGAAFDPSDWDEISVAGDGRLLAYATTVAETGLPGTARQIVFQGGVPGSGSKRIALVSAENDQPTVRYDLYGVRCAFRSAAAGGAGPSNIQLFSTSKTDDPATPPTPVAVTEFDDATDTAFDPSLAAVVRRRNAGGRVFVKERNAKVAFVSTGDLTGQNPDHLEQLFVWEEIGKVFFQVTRHSDPAAHVNRPAVAFGGDVIVFESTADLVPTAVDPLSSSRVGNPGHVRNLFRYRKGRKLEQITWSDGDCFSPRFDPSGRVVIFSSRGDPITGGNPERNLEIFEWIPSRRPAQRLEQMTRTASGNSVFPRPTNRRDVFVFYSTAHPPVAATGEAPAQPFGAGNAQCSPSALLYARGTVTLLEGKTDLENAVRLLPSRTAAQQNPVFVGPPAVGIDALRIYFATNDFAFNDPPSEDASLLLVYIATATRHVR